MKQEDITEIANQLNNYGLALHRADYTSADLLSAVSCYINNLIASDFSKLIQLLYTLDISEQQLRSCLKDTTTTLAANIIAELIIQRQQQKIEMRKMFKASAEIPEDERW